MKKIYFCLATFSLFAMTAFTQSAWAATCTSIASGNWNQSATWNCTAGNSPAAGDTVIIASPHTVRLDRDYSATNLTINAGATLDDNRRDLTLSGNAVINGIYDGSGNKGKLIMTGNGKMLSGTGTFIDIKRIQIDANITIPVGSNLNLTLDSEIRVGDKAAATLTIDGTITGTAQNNGNRIIRVDDNNPANVIINGTINAPNSNIEIKAGGTVTNNGTVLLQFLDGNNDATATWTQGANSNLTLSQPTNQWVGTFNASANGNTVTYNGTATPITPSGNTYYNLAGTGVTCPHGFTVLGSDPCQGVVSINTINPNPTTAASVSWTVTLNISVTGLSSSNFTLVNSGLGGSPAITLVTGSGTAWTVTASTGTGSGTLGLDMSNTTGVSPALANLPFVGQVYSVRMIIPVAYYHDTTTGVNIGFDGPTNVVSGTDVTIPPVITASLITANTCTGNARSKRHPTGLYTHSRWYLTTDYTVSTDISANPAGSAFLRGRRTTDTVIVSLYDYDPVSGAKVLIGSSPVITLTGGGNTTAYAYTISSPIYTVPAGHRLMLEYEFNQPGDRDRARVYCSAASSYISVTETPTTLTVPLPIADYHFDEAVWTGTAGQVVDSVSGNNGTATNGPTTSASGGAGQGVCRVGNFDGINDYVTVPTIYDQLKGTFTLSAWVNTTQTGNNTDWQAPGIVGVEQSGGTDDIFIGWLDASGRIGLNVKNDTAFMSTTAINNGQWYHVVFTRDMMSGNTNIYVDGNLENTRTQITGLVGNSFADIGRITKTNGSAAAFFQGMLDETMIFDSVLSAAQIAAGYANQLADKNWDGTTRSCNAAPHHFEIQSSGSGLTCAASTLTIKACSDSAVPCITPYTGGVVGTLSATGTPAVIWDGTTGGGAGAGFAIGGTGSVTKNVQVTTAGTVTFGINSPTPVPASATACNFGSNAPANNNCVFTADTAGFIFSNAATGSFYTIPAQVSGIASPTLYLRALQAATNNPAVCTPAIIGQTTAVTMSYTCNDPAACQPGNLTSINATAIAPAGTAVNLSFDANGSAPITTRYDDVGKITLNANKTVTPFGGATAVTLNGSSNAFVVAPHHFGISGVTGGPINAGNNFSATLTAYNGLPAPTATFNFGKEVAPEGVTLTFDKCQPTGIASSIGNFSAGNIPAFASGATTAVNLNWNEVGNGDLIADLAGGNYLGSGLTATGNTGTGGTKCNGAGNVGVFVPDHFNTYVTGPMTCPVDLTCPAGGLVYSGQSFTTNVSARNALDGITQNYDGTADTSPNFARVVTLTAWDALGSIITLNPPAADPGSLAPGMIPAASFSQGSTITGTPATLAYTFAATPTPTNPTDIYLRAADTDATSLRVIASSSIEGGIKVVSGRIKVSNAYGSELLPLTLYATAQYYSANGWINNIMDTVTNLTLAPSYPVGADGGSTVASKTPATGLNNGILTINLDAPNTQGTATITPVVSGGYLQVIPGSAAFGVYSGSTRYIYQRENY